MPKQNCSPLESGAPQESVPFAIPFTDFIDIYKHRTKQFRGIGIGTRIFVRRLQASGLKIFGRFRYCHFCYLHSVTPSLIPVPYNSEENAYLRSSKRMSYTFAEKLTNAVVSIFSLTTSKIKKTRSDLRIPKDVCIVQLLRLQNF